MDLLTTSSAIKRFIYLLIITSSAFFIQSQMDSPSAIWMILSFLFVSIITTHSTLWLRLGILLLVSIIALLGSAIASFLSHSIPLLSLYLFLTTFLSIFLGEKYPNCFFPFFLINLFIILSSGFAASELDNLERLIFLFLGFAAGIIAQLVWWPFSYKDDVRFSIQIILSKLRKLNYDVFNCFLEVDYKENIYLFERRIHEAKNKFILALGEAQANFKSKKNKLSEEENNKIATALTKSDKLFDIILDYSQLRRRVSDYTTFLLCQDELNAIAKEIDADLKTLMFMLRGRKLNWNSMLLQKIKHLEDNYQNVLRVSAREPLVFLLFIFSLKTLSKEMQTWAKELST